MKKGISSMAVFLIAAIAVFGLAGHSFAQEQTSGGPGSVLLFPYYDARSVEDGGLGLTDNYFAIINTSTHWVQSHVRIRTGDCSVELLDFDILQSPKDVFVFDLYESGGITFASCDKNTLEDSGFTLNFDADGDGTNDCFLLSSDTFPAMLSLITACGDCATGAAITTAQATELVKKGYVEVIAEGTIRPKTANKNLCFTPAAPDTVSIPGTTLRQLWDGDCWEDIYAPVAELQGRQYFVEVDVLASPVMVKRLAQANAAVINSWSKLILHEDTYAAELAAAECNADDGLELTCYAYAEAQTTDGAGVTADGANDMNYCFYRDKIGTNAVINKFGAAGTYGPTLADFYGSNRDGSLGTTANNLMSLTGLSTFDMYGSWTWPDAWPKQYVESHYFYAPAPGPYDMHTAFAFTFPLMHFIGQKPAITAREIYDNSENTETIDIGKFISPGLPTIAEFAEEAQLFHLFPPFNEGWIRFEVAATNSTEGCIDATDNLVCEVEGFDADWNRVGPSATHIPAYMGLVFTTGEENLGASPFNYNNKWNLSGDNGTWGDSRGIL
ncbi:MAG: hypothetical protein IBX72_11930 [Nitrospirae bacterium]|nr:hypothetical protein [Nitrospirota bacterium]